MKHEATLYMPREYILEGENGSLKRSRLQRSSLDQAGAS